MPGWSKLRDRSSPDEQRELLIFLALILVASLPNLGTLLGSFVYDDHFQVVQNPYAHSFRYLRETFGTTVWSFQGAQGVTNYYRPLMTFSYLLLYQIAGPVPFTFHLANIALHAGVVCLVFALLRRWSGERAAWIAAALFALHPTHTESVAWVAGVTDLQLALFYLLTFLLYLRMPRAGRGVTAAMCASFGLALLSKEQAMTLPVLATLFEHFYRDDRALTTARQKLARYGPLWAIAAVYMVARAVMLGGVASVVSRPGLSWYEVILSAVALIGGYLGMLVWPANLSAFYVFQKSSHFTDPEVLLGILGLSVCGVVFVALWQRAHLLSFGLVWMFLTLGPVLNARWMPASVFAERYLYLPSVGFCWIVGWAAARLWGAEAQGPARSGKLARAVPVMLAVIAVLYAARTITRNADWRSEETLFRQTLASQSDASLIRSNLGAILFDRGDLRGAEREWLAALAAGPNNVFVLGNLGLLRARQHRYAESLDYFDRALRARPVYTMAHINLAETLMEMKRNAEAEWQFRIATALSPLSTRAHNSYGNFLAEAGRDAEARAAYERSTRVDPTTEAYQRLGELYSRSNDPARDSARAKSAYRRALQLGPYDSRSRFGLGKILEAEGKPADALREFERGLETDPSDTQARAAAARLRNLARAGTQPLR